MVRRRGVKKFGRKSVALFEKAATAGNKYAVTRCAPRGVFEQGSGSRYQEAGERKGRVREEVWESTVTRA